MGRVKGRKVKLKQKVTASLAKYVGLFQQTLFF